MADFKKTPGGASDGKFSEFVSSTAAMVGEIATSYWPLIGGGLCLFLLIILGKERTAIPVAIAVLALQAWLSFG
jgi:hypothetical protein